MVPDKYTGCNMNKVTVLIVIIIYSIGSAICDVEGESLKGGSHVCPYSGYKKERRTTTCGFLGWSRCSTYQTVTATLYRCCPGWASEDGKDCNIPLCAGNRNPFACNINEGYVKYRDGRIVQNSGGLCVDANTCANCNEGYYPDSGYCRACTKIDKCDFPRCNRTYDTTCVYCEGEYMTEYGTYAYSRFLDGGKTCRQACSWRKGSRCFPGNCSDTTSVTCKCLDGFSGPDCNQINHTSSILVNHLKLISGLELVETPLNILSNDVQPTMWTNLKSSNMRAHAILQAIFKKELTKYRPPKYIINSTVGITYGKVQLDLYRDGNRVTTSYIHECDPGIDNPIPDNFICEGNFNLSDWEPFKHQDRIQFRAGVTNGGHVLFVNYDNFMQVEKYTLTGVTKQSSFNIVFDYQDPVHCHELVSNCSCQPIIVPDVTNTSFFQVTWDGWHDTDSGISTYDIEVFQLVPNGKVSDITKLRYGDKVFGTPGPLDSSVSKANISLRTAGAYSVLFTTFDKAGNTKSSRRILIFDNISIVEKMNDPSKVASASYETNYEWITNPCKTVHVEWNNRFASKVYERSGWLNSVEKVTEVDSVLDDNEGERQINRKDNIHGIVRFDVGYETIYDSNITHIPFKSVPDIHSESADLKEDIVDGKRMVIHVRAYDIMGKFSEDTVNVTIDTSPPVIENLWLIQGDRVNNSVSSLREFPNLTIEWLAYDIHSGINHVRWRLYDNHTGHTIVRGLNNLSLQVELSDKEECQAKYMNYSRGAHCYCTPFDGCYHRHFALYTRVSVVEDQELRPDNDNGDQDGNYIFEVEVENTAKLKTTMTIKTMGPFLVDSTSPEFIVEINATAVDDHVMTSNVMSDTMANAPKIMLIVSAVVACLVAFLITALVLFIRLRKGICRGSKNDRSETDPHINDIGLCQPKENDGVSDLQDDARGEPINIYEALNNHTRFTPDYEELPKGLERESKAESHIYCNMILNNVMNEH